MLSNLLVFPREISDALMKMGRRTVFCMEHKLEGFQVELFELAGVKATDELVQGYHLYSSQLLRCQVVMFSSSPPDQHHLFRQDIVGFRHNYQDSIHQHMNECLKYVGSFNYITCDSFQPQCPMSSSVSSEKGSFLRMESEKPRLIHPICATTLSVIFSTGPKTCRNTGLHKQINL